MDEISLQVIDRDIGLFMAIVREILSQGMLEEICEEITVGQARCLCFILAHEGVTIGHISKGLGISYPAATKTVSRLEEKGLLARKPDSVDRRTTYVEITPLGREMTARIKPEKLRRLGSLLDRLTSEELTGLCKGIEAFLSAAVTDPELVEQICLHCGREHMENCVLSSIKCRRTVASG